MRLDAKILLEAQLARSLGLDSYEEIMTVAPVTDVSLSSEFQRKFNAYYRVRRNEEWRKSFYSLFERAKKEHYSFVDVIGLLFVETGNVEASFSSKMIATIDDSKPIWDQYVLMNLGLELKGKTPRERVINAAELYRRIEDWYMEYLLTDEAKENIAVFNRMLPDYTWVSDVKKIDCLLWGKRD